MRKIYDKIIAPFTQNQLANFDAFLQQLKKFGCSAEEFTAVRRQAQGEEQHRLLIEAKRLRAKARRPKKVNRTSKKPALCPECGKPLVTVDTGDKNVRVIGCKQCRYSTLDKMS